jgi:hypothetical protein
LRQSVIPHAVDHVERRRSVGREVPRPDLL